MVEEHLYFVLLYSRWIDPVGWETVSRDFRKLRRSSARPFCVSSAASWFARRRAGPRPPFAGRSCGWAVAMSTRSPQSSANAYVLGESWTSVDATVYARVTILRQPIESELKAAVTAHGTSSTTATGKGVLSPNCGGRA